ncbi:MAG: hypothetical protein KDJ99_01165, partial [Candidatus Competibacteraceae bacterium]|nr:hypothetical protein [Candidatus Competibacteraceae bacterium]
MSDTSLDAEHSGLRSFTGLSGKAVSGLAIFLSLGHLFLAIFPWLSELERNVFHFAGFSLLCALIYPMARRKWST